MDRSRGGLTTKIHALTDARGLPRDFELTPGQTHDPQGAEALLKDLAEGEVVLRNKAMTRADCADASKTGARPEYPRQVEP